MPRKAARPCSYPGCPNLVKDPKRRFCDEHQAQAWKRESAQRRRDGTHADYGPLWAKISKAYLRKHPTCTRCGRPAEVVHHIKPRDVAGDSSSNLTSLCRVCHSRTHAEQGDYFG